MKRSLRGTETFAAIAPIDCDKGVNPNEFWVSIGRIMNQDIFFDPLTQYHCLEFGN